MKENKIWGETRLIWSGNNTETHQIKIKKGGYCSKHKHLYKYNLFYIDRGKLLIETWKENGIVDETLLIPGESTIVGPGQYHRFKALEQTNALEVYWVDLKEGDIIREDCGGLLKGKK